MDHEAITPDPAGQQPSRTAALHAALDAIPADDPRNYLRQSLQLLLPLLEEILNRLESLEVRVAALESGRPVPNA
jgi:hypothetical protein